MLLLALMVAAPPAARAQADTASARRLVLPVTLTREIATSQEHAYVVPLSMGERVRVTVSGGGVDLWLRVYAPDGTWMNEAVSSDSTAPLRLEFQAESAGSHRIAISSPDPRSLPRRYTLEGRPVEQVEARRADAEVQAATTWLARNAHPLRSVDASAQGSDLLPLKSMLAGVRVLAIGEATHGTREFHQVGHRLTRFLVQQMGYTVFALETSAVGAKALNEYVLEGKGDPVAALTGQGMFIWDTREFAELVDWLRGYNRTVPVERRVAFVGFDMQYSPGSRQLITAFLARVAPDRVAAADSTLGFLTAAADSARPDLVLYYRMTPDQKKPVRSGITELLGFLELNRTEFARRTSRAEVDSVMKRVRLLAQFADIHSRPGFEQDRAESGVATRDRYLAENVLDLLSGQNGRARIIVYTHNEHARREPYRMGYYLGQALGQQYYALGTSFHRGGFQALQIGEKGTPLRRFTFGPAFQNSVGWYMKRAQAGDLYVDFRRRPASGLAADWLARPHAMRSIGFGYSEGNPSGYYRAPAVLGRSFDGIVFIEQTSSARSNPSVRR